MRINYKFIAYFIFDLICAAVALALSSLMRFDMSILGAFKFAKFHFGFVIAMLAVPMIFSVIFKTYRTIYVSISFRDTIRQALITGVSLVAVVIIHILFDFPMSYSIWFMSGILFFIFTLAIRCVEQVMKSFRSAREISVDKKICRAIIVGAGQAGSMLVDMLITRRDTGIIPVAIVDDDPFKQKMLLAGVPVMGTVSDVAEIAKQKRADVIIVAIPSASSVQMKEIFEKCHEAALPIKSFGSIVDFCDFISGSKTALRDLSIEDLLFRDAIKTDMTPVCEYIKGKSVLVTGGAGSIGSEICRQVLEYGCKNLVAMDINENGLFYLRNDLLEKYPEDRFSVRVGSVRDKKRMGYLFSHNKFDVVFHAAAHKHVPLMEDNPFEAVKNNVLGTKNTIECCIENGVSKFILISTDKAVNPTNVMGATKRAAELLVKYYNGRGCELAAVRFGNVLGSNGSVIPIFKKQIEAGGPITVTHRDIMRYFMTIPEAVSLVLNAGVMACGGETFVLDMGEPVKIYDLAKNMIEIAGLRVGEDIEIKITGLRPGEKLFEELKLDSETHRRTNHNKIFVMNESDMSLWGDEFDGKVKKLSELLEVDCGEEALRSALFDTIAIDFEESTARGGDLNSFCELT